MLQLPRADPLEHRASLIGAVVSALVALTMYLEMIVTDAFDVWRAFGAVLVAILLAAGYVARRAVVVPAAAFGLFASVVFGTLLGAEAGRTLIYLSYVIIAGVFGTFARRHVWVLVGVTSAVGLATPWVWEHDPLVSMMCGVGVAITGYLMATMRRTMEAALRRTNAVLDLAPIVIMEQDWREVDRGLDALRRTGVTDLEAHLDANPEVVADLMARVSMRFGNRAALRAYGAADQDDLAARFAGAYRARGFVNDRSFPSLRDHLVAAWHGDQGGSAEASTYSFTGEPIWYQIEWVSHPDDDAVRILAASDVTAMKQAHAELEEVNESKVRFVASVSHELRTPLAAVLGFSNELLDHDSVFGPTEKEDLLLVVRDQAQEAANIIEDLLVAARADIGGVTVAHGPVDLVATIDAVVRSVHVDLTLQIDGPISPACGDAGRIRQVVRNLITNAVRYGGDERGIGVHAAGSEVVIDVYDNGRSLTVEDMARIFDPYASAHTRLGLTD